MFCLHQKKVISHTIIFSAGTSDQYIIVKEKLFHIKLSKNEPICHSLKNRKMTRLYKF